MSHISGKVPVIVCNPYENLVIDEDLPRPRNNRITHCYSSKYFWFAICHCILFLLLIIIALIVCNHIGFTPTIFKLFQVSKATEDTNSKSYSKLDNQEACPTGYFFFEETNSCYKATPIPTLFEGAVSVCAADEAHLTSIHSEIENIFIAGLYHESDVKRRQTADSQLKWNYWIGMVRMNGIWGWMDGSPVDYRNWHSREGKGNDQTAISGTGYKWHAVSGRKRGFVCKKPSTHSPTPEMKSNYNPCRSGYTWFPSTESCYKVFLDQTSFEDAATICENSSSELVSIHSETETILIRGLVEKTLEINGMNDTNLWIGLTHKNNQLGWVDGSKVDYENWDSGEPNHSEEYWATVMPHWTAWKNENPSKDNGFICKMY